MTSEQKELKEATEVTKSILDLIGLEVVDLEDEKITDEAVMNVACEAEVFYTKIFEKRLKILAYRHLKNNATSETDGSVLFFKGALYGLQEVQDWFKKQVGIARSRFDKEEEDNSMELKTDQ